MIAVDSSVAIAGFADWHELNRLACTLVRTLAEAGRTGGAVYDALVALTAKAAGATLTTADRRAASMYELVACEHRLLR